MELKQSIIINRPIAEVFDIATCHQRCVVWRGPIIGAQKTTPGPVGVGTTYHHSLSLLGVNIEAHPVITAWRPPYRAEFENTTGPAAYKSVFTLEPTPYGTKLTTAIELDIVGLFKHIPQVLFKQAALRQHQADLQTLKELMESGTEIKI